MALLLQTSTGEIKEYDTTKDVGSGIGGEVSGPDKWISKCGMEWKKMPESYQECDHLECAISAVDDWPLYGWMAAFFGAFAAISLFFSLKSISILIVMTLAFGFISFVVLAMAYEKRNRFIELNEFKNTGTIKGLKAWKISKY